MRYRTELIQSLRKIDARLILISDSLALMADTERTMAQNQSRLITMREAQNALGDKIKPSPHDFDMAED